MTGAVGNRTYQVGLNAVGNRSLTLVGAVFNCAGLITPMTGAVGNRTYQVGLNAVGNRTYQVGLNAVGNRTYQGGLHAVRGETAPTGPDNKFTPIYRGDRDRGAKVSICFLYSP